MGKSTDFIDRTLKRLRNTWADVSHTIRSTEELSFSPDLTDDEVEKLNDMITRCLDAPAGEVFARALAAQIGRGYMSLSLVGKERFLSLLASRYDVDDVTVKKAIASYMSAEDTAQLPLARRDLLTALKAPRLRLLTQFNALPEGIKFLVDMREELLDLDLAQKPDLAGLEKDLKELLSSWFDIGFLHLKTITWNSPASLLEKLIEYEAVHEIASWDDLKNRLDSDRRLFAFFHPNMPDEPLIFVQVALVDGLSDNIQKLLDPTAPIVDTQLADTAIFYSISNAQRGLSGISFGNHLIKQVVSNLKREFPHLKQFATLSPLPGFTSWLNTYLAESDLDSVLTKSEHKDLADVAALLTIEPNLQTILAFPDWHQNSQISATLKPILLRFGLIYLKTQKENSKQVVNPVAHFHLANGAIIQRMNWLADTSVTGLTQSAGMMVNYLYKLESINANSENYALTGDVVLSKSLT